MKTNSLTDRIQSAYHPARRRPSNYPEPGTAQGERGTRKTNAGLRAPRGAVHPGSAGLEIHEIWEEKRGDTWVTCILGREHGVPVGLVIDARGRAFANGGTIPANV